MSVQLDPLPGDSEGGLSPVRAHVQVRLIHLHEPVYPIPLEPIGETVPVRERLLAGRNPDRHRAYRNQRGDLRRMIERIAGGGVTAHRVPAEHRPLVRAASRENRSQVRHELLVSVARSIRRGRRLAVPARVIGEQPVPLPRQGDRPVQDVTPGGGDPVENDDRRTFAHLLPHQPDA
jgi:hypothetical protein